MACVGFDGHLSVDIGIALDVKLHAGPSRVVLILGDGEPLFLRASA
jgi:transketolase N-terminal domain/subunit